MAFLDGIFGRSNQQANAAAAPAAAAPAPAPAGGPATRQTEMANPGANPATMVNGAQAPAGGPENPLDAFSNMFAPRKVDPKAPVQPTLRDPILGALDPAAFQQQVQQANFAAAIPQETMQKAMAGDAAAFGEAINVAAREAFAAAAKLSHGLVEHGSRTAAERVEQGLDSKVRNHLIRTQNVDNAILNHPAVAPLVGGVKAQIAASNPQLSAQDVVNKTAEYFQTFAQSFSQSVAPAPAAPTGPKEVDFSTYLN